MSLQSSEVLPFSYEPSVDALRVPLDPSYHEASVEVASFLKAPWLRTLNSHVFGTPYTIRSFDQPGRWMSDAQLNALVEDLHHVAAGAMDEVPTYGVFAGRRRSFENRVIAVAYHAKTRKAVGFTAMVYLPYEQGDSVEPLVHLGLTMIRRDCRGQRLQTPLFKRVFLMPFLNQRRGGFIVTNIAASPAGIGATSDYFTDVYPHYAGNTPLQAFHLDVARQVLNRHRHEFGCSQRARFDANTFVVHGSNEPEGGGAAQFITDAPVSRYRVASCNVFCRENLDSSAGDELFQVGRADLFKGLWRSRRSKRQ